MAAFAKGDTYGSGGLHTSLPGSPRTTCDGLLDHDDTVFVIYF